MIDETVDLYFETKRFTESDIVRNGNTRLIQTPLQMLESSMLKYRTSQNNAYLFSCTNQSITQMEIEFIRLRTWINELENVKCKHELSQLLFPIFSHLYLDTICESNGQPQQSAMIFFKRHQSFFTSDSLRDIMKDVGNICRKEEIENKPLVKTFRSAKCKLKLSSMSGTLLKNYLSNCDEPTILLNVLSSWFVMEDEDSNIREDDDPSVFPESEMIMGRRVEENSSPNKIDLDDDSDSDQEICNDRFDDCDTIESWTSCIKNLRNYTPQACPLLLLEIHNNQNVSCSSVCYQSKLLAFGCLDSDVKVSSFSEPPVPLFKNKSLPVKLNVTSYNDEDSSCRPKMDFLTLRGHCGSVSAVKLLNDPDIILSSSHDSTLRAWSREDFACNAVYRGHNSPIWDFDVSALNLYVATGSQDKTARLWTLDKTYPLRLYVGHYSSVTCVRFHPNGSYLASGSTDKTVRLFSVIDGKIARLFVGHSGPVHSLSFSPDGQYLASAGDCNEVIVWDLAFGQQYLSISTESQFVTDLSWNLDSTVLAITFFTRSICLLYVHKNSKEAEHEIIGKYNLSDLRFVSCQFLEKNNLVAVGVV